MKSTYGPMLGFGKLHAGLRFNHAMNSAKNPTSCIVAVATNPPPHICKNRRRSILGDSSMGRAF